MTIYGIYKLAAEKSDFSARGEREKTQMKVRGGLEEGCGGEKKTRKKGWRRQRGEKQGRKKAC